MEIEFLDGAYVKAYEMLNADHIYPGIKYVLPYLSIPALPTKPALAMLVEDVKCVQL